ncbi:MAG: PAS domain-containing protein [Bacteroidota bacterium]|nr:PAS domain-containing protein [Bacteroidota bacterium]
MSEEDKIVRLENNIKTLEEELAKANDQFYRTQLEIQDLKEQKDHFKLVADFASDWEFWIDPEGKYRYISPSCQTITGYAAQEIMRSADLISEIIYPEDLPDFKHYMSNSLNFSDIGKTLEFRILTRTKQLRWCEVNSKAVFDQRGKYLGQRGAIRDITRFKTALGQIQELSQSKQYETKAKIKYKEDLEYRDRELMSSLMLISQKNELILYLRKQLKTIRPTTALPVQKKIEEMLLKIEGLRQINSDWDNFSLHFEKLYPGFFERLSQKYPRLTSREKKLCAYLRLNLSSKEIANILNITPESAEISRIRLRRKFNLDRKIQLTDFISKI